MSDDSQLPVPVEPPRLSVWSRTLELSQAGPTRRRWSNIIVGAGDYLPLVALLVTVSAAMRGIATTTPWVLLTGIALGVMGALTKTFKTGLDLRDKAQKKRLEDEMESLKNNIADRETEVALQASLRVYEHWKNVAQLHEDGMYNANRQLHPALRFNPDETAPSDAVDSYLTAIIAVFDAFFEDHNGKFSANLVVPNNDCSRLWLVRIEPGGKGRSNPLPREIDLSHGSWGVAEAFQHKRIIYTEDVRQHGSSGDRGYLSVVNLPVAGITGEIIAVVNVDSPNANSFSSQESVKAAAEYCLSILSSLALCLGDIRLFKEQRK